MASVQRALRRLEMIPIPIQNFITKNLRPWWQNASGYRKYGLLMDDLIIEEDDDVQIALSRLSQKQRDDRIFRLKVALNLSVQHRILPKELWIKPEDAQATSSHSVLELDCAVQSYAWGKIGTDSAVAQLSENITGFTAESNTPYAELWMGTHPKGPATLKKDGTLLRTWLADNQWALGSKVIDRFGGGELPFLLKVLSVKKALSIQAHPDKALAEKLYAANPKNYPDDNHKPEMCIAITTFTGLMGFRPLCELSEHLQQVKELRAVVGEEASKALIEYVESHPQESQKGGADPKAREVLHGVYASIMHADDALVVSQLTNLMNRLDNTSKDTHTVAEQLAYTIHQSFPGDVGVFSVFILNFVTLMPGESMFMAANEPHAYLSGDCVECMACSDNVVRAGLTPKFKDVENLLSMLTYKYGPAQEHTLHAVPFPSDKYMQMYDPPIPEFALGVITVPTATQYEMAAIDGPSLVLVLEGEGSIENTDITLMKGSVFFVAANVSPTITTGCDSLKMCRAFCML